MAKISASAVKAKANCCRGCSLKRNASGKAKRSKLGVNSRP
ncbi:Uncharacterised protein [Vibrio cholerae]|nr:Uncharacterised protein [Vibrio cholerae]CSI51098.1 Uncharacterised protein [Vibrio cholerae]